MADKNTPGDKKLSVPSKTLTLKPRIETGTVRQSFPHGRSKQVVVEKRGKRRIGGEAPAEVPHAPEPVAAAAKAAPAPDRLGRGAADADRGRACRARQCACRCTNSRAGGTAAGRRRSKAPRQPR